MNILQVIALTIQLTFGAPSSVIVVFPQADPATDNLRVSGRNCTWLTYEAIVCYPPDGESTLTLDVQMDCSINQAWLTVWERKGYEAPSQRIVTVQNTADCPKIQQRAFLPWLSVAVKE